VLVLSDAARGVIALLFLVVVPRGGLAGAFGLVFALYVANTFFLPARSAVLPDMAPADRLTEANSLVTLAGVAATIAGSLIGGVAVQRFGWRAGFAFDAVTYFVSALALTQIRVAAAAAPRAAVSSEARSATGAYRALWADVREGARITLGSRRVMGAIAATGLLWVAGGALHVAAPILLSRRGEGIVAGVGTILAAAATGMVAGSLLLAARGRGRTPWKRVGWGLLGTGAALILFARSHNPALDLALGFVAGVFAALLLVTTEALLQESIAAEVRARVFALRDVAARILVLIAAGLAGALLARAILSPEWTILGAGALLVLGGFWLAVWAEGRRGDGGGTAASD
jgi:MFS family permease